MLSGRRGIVAELLIRRAASGPVRWNVNVVVIGNDCVSTGRSAVTKNEKMDFERHDRIPKTVLVFDTVIVAEKSTNSFRKTVNVTRYENIVRHRFVRNTFIDERHERTRQSVFRRTRCRAKIRLKQGCVDIGGSGAGAGHFRRRVPARGVYNFQSTRSTLLFRE